ncbi:MAG TPA: hypothetical protein ENN29_07690 [Candidatus Hydrogenedentes bacterium]|nr:hypothetical protein [Candidatus Hydrogenedentota bacterium]
MRILADQNIPRQTVDALRLHGYDVTWIHEDMPGVPDTVVLERAQQEQRSVLTFDKDFGHLAMRQGVPASCGVILLRIEAPSSVELTKNILQIIESRSDWAGHFTVIKKNHVRMIPLNRS